MSSVKVVKGSIDYTLNRVIPILDKMIALFPENQLNFKPTFKEGEPMTLAELAIHCYEMAYAYTRATEKGQLTEDDFKGEYAKPKSVTSVKEITDYGIKVKNYVQTTSSTFKEAQMKREITFVCWGNFKLTGYQAMMTIFEEIVHHRGQICVYLRMIGIKPPFIYS